MNSTMAETINMPEGVSSYPPPEELIPAHWREQVVTANGIQQHLFRTGKRSPEDNALLLLHGFMVDGTGWVRTARALEGEYDVIMPDARAHGRSERTGQEFSLEQLGADLIALIEALGLSGVTLLGHSMGASTAAHVAAARPDLVRKVILEEPALRAAPDMGQISPEWYQSWLAGLRSLKGATHEERMAIAQNGLTPGAQGWHAADLVTWVHGMAAFDLSVLELGPALYALPPWEELVPRIKCPLLLLTGDPERGSTSTPEALQAFTALWRNGEHGQLACGHVLHAEAFDEFVEAVREFSSRAP